MDIESNVSLVLSSENIRNLVYLIRNKQVMLDTDLAELYQVETRILNQAVKRNIKRFPEEFYFQLTDDENNNLKSQNVISNSADARGGRRTNSYVFTEQGISMLSAILRSDIAINVSINIMKAFVEIRHFISNNALLFEKISLRRALCRFRVILSVENPLFLHLLIKLIPFSFLLLYNVHR